MKSWNFSAQLWKIKQKGKLLNKLRRWQYYYRNTTIPDVGNTGFIKVFDKGLYKILTFHNLTKAVELAENTSTLDSHHMWKWNVESSDLVGWSRISITDGLFLTSKLIGGRSRLAVEKMGKCKASIENKKYVVFLNELIR